MFPSGSPAPPTMQQGAEEVKEKRRRKKQVVYLASQGGRSRQAAGQGQTRSGPRAHKGSGHRGTAAHTDDLWWAGRVR